jgi:hypothetical protein
VGLGVSTTYFLIINGRFESHICFVYKKICFIYGGTLMKYYLSLSSRTSKSLKKIVTTLGNSGYKPLGNWAISKDNWPDRIEEVEQLIQESDFVIIIVTEKKGNLAEIGAALTFGKKVFAYIPEKTLYTRDKHSILNHIPDFYICTGSIDQLINIIQQSFFQKNDRNDIALT